MNSIGTGWMWIGFFIFVLIVLTIDMVILRKTKSHRVTVREALSWVLIWISCAVLFGILLWWYLLKYVGEPIASERTLEFFTGYIIEQSLSVDNMFVFILIFNYFAVPPEYQRRVLLYGVLSAIVLRLILILSGTWLVSQFHWILYVFGVFLVVTGIKMLLSARNEKSLKENFIIRWVRSHLRVTEKFHDEHFFMKQKTVWYVTPLFLTLIFIELSDLIFALDSIPAIFAVTNDPFIIFTSNIFAILGLRMLYFLLSNMTMRFYLLKYGIAILLAFVGIKMLIEPWIKIPITLALSIVVAVLAVSIILSAVTSSRHLR